MTQSEDLGVALVTACAEPSGPGENESCEGSEQNHDDGSVATPAEAEGGAQEHGTDGISGTFTSGQRRRRLGRLAGIAGPRPPEVSVTAAGVYWHPVAATDPSMKVAHTWFPLATNIDDVRDEYRAYRLKGDVSAKSFPCA